MQVFANIYYDYYHYQTVFLYLIYNYYFIIIDINDRKFLEYLTAWNINIRDNK